MREAVKRALALAPDPRATRGSTVLIYHRVGGGSPDERDLTTPRFRQQLAALADTEVLGLDDAMARLGAGSDKPCSVISFDDGFADVFRNAWPLLREREMPFTIYLSTAYVGGTMRWDGSTAKAAGPALTWDQLGVMVESGLCTIGNHTHTHARPELLTVEELDRCSDLIRDELGVEARHFAYCWGVPVPAMEGELRKRFRTAATGHVGRNPPGTDPMRLRRVPVRGSDPIEFFRAKLSGSLLPERTYGALVAAAKRAGMQA